MPQDHMTLLGAEDVRSAANTIRSAAESMSQAALNVSAALERHERFLDDWLSRYEALITPAPEAPVEPKPEMMPWGGGFCPVSDDKAVCVELRDGAILYGSAPAFSWRHYTGRSPAERANEVVKWRLT